MMKEEEIKMRIFQINTTAGVVSASQLIDTTSSDIFIIMREDTSGVKIQQIIYSPTIIERPKESKE